MNVHRKVRFDPSTAAMKTDVENTNLPKILGNLKILICDILITEGDVL